MLDCRTDSGDIHLLLSLLAEGDCCIQTLQRYKRLLEDRESACPVEQLAEDDCRACL